MENKKAHPIEITIPSCLEFMDLVLAVCDKVAEKVQFDESENFDIKFAVEEALVNAIIHGNKLDPDKKVIIRIAFDAEQVEVSVIDEGAGFNEQKIPDPRDAENRLKPNGRGILLIKALMDEVGFRCGTPKGMEVYMRKNGRKNLIPLAEAIRTKRLGMLTKKNAMKDCKKVEI